MNSTLSTSKAEIIQALQHVHSQAKAARLLAIFESEKLHLKADQCTDQQQKQVIKKQAHVLDEMIGFFLTAQERSESFLKAINSQKDNG